jgi:triosephosphate isomerase (TIM)
MAVNRPKPLVAGNWKMNGLKAAKKELATLCKTVTGAKSKPKCNIMICPPATILALCAEVVKKSGVQLGGQNCHAHASGAHTGDLSAEMIKNAGARACIVGHSERRADHGESSAEVKLKAQAAHRAGLTAIICVGETSDERAQGKTLKIVGQQLKASLPTDANQKNTVIAYEPVWAIGTGLTPTVTDIKKVHEYIRKRLIALLGDEIGVKIRILYGGSVKPSNAQELMAVENVNGALVGGASLKAKDFLGIIAAYEDTD